MKRQHVWLVPLFCLLPAVLPTPALAAPPTTTGANAGASQSLFDEGLDLKNKGKYLDAIDRFQRSHELAPSVGALVQIGECYEKLDKPASAWGAFHEADTLAYRTKDDRQPKVAKMAMDLVPKLARLTLTVPHLEGITVMRDGVKVDPAIFNTQVPIDHGPHVFEATAPGRKPWTGKIDVARAAVASLTIPDLEHLPTTETPASAPPPNPMQRNVGIGLEIGGGTVLVAGLVFGALTMGSWSSAEQQCPEGRCPTPADRDASQSAADRASLFGTFSTIGVIVGAAALAGGIVLHLTAPKAQTTALSANGLVLRF